MDVHYILRNSIIKKKNWFVTGRNVMYNMHKESRSGNKKNEQFYERRELFQKTSWLRKWRKKSSGEKIIVKIEYGWKTITEAKEKWNE